MISWKRHAAKTMTWRIVATTTTVLIVGIATGEWAIAGGVGAVDAAVKMVLYYLHERVWYRFVGLDFLSFQNFSSYINIYPNRDHSL